MKLYVPHCKSCRQKIPLSIKAPNRAAVRSMYGNHFTVECSNCYNVNQYTSSEICAETDSNSAISGGVIGAAVGLLGGPLGAIIGGSLGAGLGNEQDKTEKAKVERFNRSH